MRMEKATGDLGCGHGWQHFHRPVGNELAELTEEPR